MNHPPTMHRLNPYPTSTICDGCRAKSPEVPGRPLTLDEYLALDPTDTCLLCGAPLLEAGKVKRDLEKLGFEFVTHADWSAWMRSTPLGGGFDQTGLSLSVVDFLVRRDDWHAPLDDEDGPVVLKRCRTWPLVQPGLTEVGAFHWVQEHEAHGAQSVTALIALLRDGVL